ncbi:MAG: alpha/beta fold hydrolase [Betaproteobacteria bacterium]|nr:alpha/beta fold hydrolase [Betaproteobacteria bacterium]
MAGALLAGAPVLAAPSASICASAGQAVREEGFVPLGGVEQWVTVKGADCANPVILFLHGGPGNPLSPYADALYGAWEKDYTLVQWDQRGAGRTFGRSPPGESALTVERMAADGVELARYVTRRLGAKKVVLLGGSWGSILGVHMAKARPDLFHAYVGVSQVVSYRENPATSYAKVSALAKAAGDEKTVSTLAGIGPPPWENPRHFGILRRATRAYEAKSSAPAPKAWWAPAPGYDTRERLAEAEEGEDYSYLQFVGRKGDGLYSKVDLAKQVPAFAIPVFLVHGAEDLVATPEVAKRYFDGITAPRKEFVLVPQAGHDPNPALIEAQRRVVKQLALPPAR